MVQIRGIDIHVAMNGDDSLPTVVLLHGFTGSTVTWQEVTELFEGKFRTVAIDLTGHGKTAAPEDIARYSMTQQVEDLEALFDKLSLERFALLGYSMGGRVALAYAVQYPRRLSSLILESASPGLTTAKERANRKAADNRLADKILADGLPAFVDFWESIPLFDSQRVLSEEKKQAVRNERLSQRELGLANSLRGMGTGSQPSYWQQLHTLNLAILLITGELDTKFVNIAREMMSYFSHARHETIVHVGHAIHVENPAVFATMVEEHILKGAQ
ncbi:2-succinyl-6-hydroxy-2,4-cyclohexadiene-1-carboxylate synthase [Sporosarcina sp. YIM B06819]|uniref:2-succinyl-6-hydroxy-2, 4-cyclohexadiene-1-carboxylate synthase n=1 Tax=Sporosarcina sp. YIM B06819 TaxID=3081769 RepID=UPI00298C1442|nr:2-succinyl-6-hydroxy-2,4-cyclohexadiene-1-carboxylate synthase [Sporosarcina sp. YIM B06819]